MLRNQHGATHLFFDLDDTLWDFKANASAAFRIIFQEFKAVLPNELTPDRFLEAYVPIAEQLWTKYGRGEIDQQTLRRLRTEMAFSAVGVHSAGWMKAFSDAYIECCPGLGQLFPGTHDVLTELQKRYTLGLLTNGFPEVQAIKISTSGLDPYFEHIITTDKAQSRKPEQKIFDYALKQAGISEKEAVMIGDHYEIDIITPRDAGWGTILVHKINPDPDKTHVHVTNLIDILKHV